MILYQLSVFLHILSAVIWIGGMFFLALVVVPVTHGLPPRERSALFGAVGRRFRAVGWACIGVLIVTGMINSAYRGVSWDNLFSAELWGSQFGTTLALKLGVIGCMLALSLYHDFAIGPRSVRLMERAGSAPTQDTMAEAQRLRQHASRIGRVEAILALIVLLLAIMLVRGVPAMM